MSLCVLWLPTSFGKISCFQVFPFMIDHKLVLVGTKKSCSVLISPLVVVMMDQADICETKSFWIPIVLNKFIACFAYIQSLHKLKLDCLKPRPSLWSVMSGRTGSLVY